MNETMVCFSCWGTTQPPRRRRRIDRSMIGQPTDFRHTGHIGSAEVNGEAQQEDHSQLTAVTSQMRSKGGYDHVTPVHISLNVVDVQRS